MVEFTLRSPGLDDGPDEERRDTVRRIDRSKFLWNQQRYILENIKLADTKAGFVMTFAAALLGAGLSPTGRLSLNLVRTGVGDRALAGTLLAVAGICGLVAAALLGAWSIKPRLRGGNDPSPVSWVNVARYRDVESFQRVSRALDEDTSADHLAEQVFYLSRICVTKHHLVSNAILLALSGGLCMGMSILVR